MRSNCAVVSCFALWVCISKSRG